MLEEDGVFTDFVNEETMKLGLIDKSELTGPFKREGWVKTDGK